MGKRRSVSVKSLGQAQGGSSSSASLRQRRGNVGGLFAQAGHLVRMQSDPDSETQDQEQVEQDQGEGEGDSKMQNENQNQNE